MDDTTLQTLETVRIEPLPTDVDAFAPFEALLRPAADGSWTVLGRGDTWAPAFDPGTTFLVVRGEGGTARRAHVLALSAENAGGLLVQPEDEWERRPADREERRSVAGLEVEFVHPSGVVAFGAVRDVSLHGLRLEHDGPDLEAGTELRLEGEVTRPDGTAWSWAVDATVAWASDGSAGLQFEEGHRTVAVRLLRWAGAAGD